MHSIATPPPQPRDKSGVRESLLGVSQLNTCFLRCNGTGSVPERLDRDRRHLAE